MNRFKHGKPAKCVSHDGTMQGRLPRYPSFPFVYRIGGDRDDDPGPAPIEPPRNLNRLGDYMASAPASEQRLFRRLVGDRRGVAAIEAALVMPIFITLLLGSAFYGIAMLTANQLQFAVESSALCGAYQACTTQGQVQQYAINRMAGSPFVAASTFTINMSATCSGGNGTGVQVNGTLNYQLFTMFPQLTLQASACAPAMPVQS